VDNIKIDLREIGWDGIDWIDLAEDRDQCRAILSTVMNFRARLVASQQRLRSVSKKSSEHSEVE
jgi:hypothetical protein